MTNQFRVAEQDLRPNSIVFNTKYTNEIAKFTEDGFYYKGEFVDDAGEVHRLFKDVMYEMRLETWKEYCERLLRAIDSGNKDAEELVLCQIRAALNETTSVADQQANWVQRAGRAKLEAKAQAVMDAVHAQDAEPYPLIVAAALRETINQCQNWQGFISAADLYMLADYLDQSTRGKDYPND